MIKKYAAIVMAFFMVFLVSACAPKGVTLGEENDLSADLVDKEPTEHADQNSENASSAGIVGKYIQLQPTTLNTRTVDSVLEFDGTILCVSYEAEDDNLEARFIAEAFDLHSGAYLYSYSSKDYQQYGTLYRIDKASDLDRYNYRLIFERAVIYKNSNAQSDSLIYELPGIEPITLTETNPNGQLDVYSEHITWTGTDGVWIADRDGKNHRLILKNDDLAKEIPSYPNGIKYSNPRFICCGSKIVAGVLRPGENIRTAAVSFDLGTGRIDHRLVMDMPRVVDYPIADRYMIGNGTAGPQMLDVNTGNHSDYRLEDRNHPFYYSYDYKVMVVAKYASMDFDGMKAYVCNVGESNDETQPILSINDDTRLFVKGITEHYVVLGSDDSLIISEYQ